MVDCPKCQNKMQYIKTDIDTGTELETIITITARAHYHCPVCCTDATLQYDKEMKLQ